MVLARTWSIINRLVDTYEIALVQKFRVLHFLIYAISLLIIAPALWQVVVSDIRRKQYVLSYVNALRKEK
tara:strand:+ start:157 stop:366 length:210 start_codon:yes stop_codon:yes gene_type:complete